MVLDKKKFRTRQVNLYEVTLYNLRT